MKKVLKILKILKILVTAGNTKIRIDNVRSITNDFLGTTGTLNAIYFAHLGHKVTLLTSTPYLLAIKDLKELPENLSYLQEFYNMAQCYPYDSKNLTVIPYIFYEDLYTKMESLITDKNNPFDAIVHSSAVSDYKVSQIMINDENDKLVALDNTGKVSSSYNKLYFELVPTVKIIDNIRDPWGFPNLLVKFKLLSKVTDEELIKIAIDSMRHSKANIIVANCKEWHKEYAYIIEDTNTDPIVTYVARENLSVELGRRLFK